MMQKNKEANKESYWDKFSKKLFRIDGEFDPRRVSVRIAGIYVILGALWILLSDKILEMIVSDKQTLILISLTKGWIYALITGLVIFSLTYSALKKIKTDEHRILESYQELTSTYEELEAAHEEITASEEELRQQFETLIESQRQLLESEERYRLILEATNDGIWDEQDGKRYFSERWYEITGYTREDIDGLGDWKCLIHPDDLPATDASVLEHRQGKTPFYCSEYRMKAKNGRYIWIQTRGKALFNENGNVYRMAGSHSDITKLKEYQQELYHIAHHDPLTGLPNRLALYSENALLFSSSPDEKFALMFIDVDNFKFTNDTLGHNFGDQLIKLLGKRLEGLLEKNCLPYRLGGDEFIIVVKDTGKEKEVEAMAGRILAGFKEPFKVGGSMVHINISIGISLYPEHGRDTNELLRCADIAMYKAKEAGGDRHVVYSEQINKIIAERVLIEKHLRTALENNEFTLHYQPQLDIRQNRITGLEALLRWNSRELGPVSPLKFIRIAEETHLIMPLGEWVLKNACAFIKNLHLQGQTDVNLSVNISMLQLLQNDFEDLVLDILEYYELDPQCLELEITESILMESYEAIAGKLKRLCGKGLKIALDDFGKGYSSLSYLKQLPIATLKIDKSFIDNISSESGSKLLTGQIVTMGRNLGLNVVAEGVETQEQFEYLIRHKCHKIQGYLFSKPLPEREAEEMVVNRDG